MDINDLPMGGCSTVTAHNEHIDNGDMLCENDRGFMDDHFVFISIT